MAGFFHQEDPTAYKFGDANLGATILQPDGQWDAYLPEAEDQGENGYDPYTCASQGSEHAISALINRQFNIPTRYAERWLAYNVETRKNNGADPQRVAQYWRDNGIPLEEQWPSNNLPSMDAFYAPPPSWTYEQAKTWKHEYELGHDIVPSDPTAMMVALKYSPLGVSVRFDREQDGVYWKLGTGPDSHWVMVYGYKEHEYFKVFDSAAPYFKKLRWDYSGQLVKRYVVTRSVQISLMQRLIELLKQMVAALIAQKPPAISPNPTTPPMSPKPAQTPSVTLYDVAYASIGKDLSKRAPPDRGCAESLSRIIAQVVPGFPILLSTIDLKAALRTHPRFKHTEGYKPGTIAIAPTFGTKIGHCWVMGKKDAMSNDSSTGLFSANYTNAGVAAAAKKRGLKLFYFELH